LFDKYREFILCDVRKLVPRYCRQFGKIICRKPFQDNVKIQQYLRYFILMLLDKRKSKCGIFFLISFRNPIQNQPNLPIKVRKIF
jgi:hypothetical protein